MLSKTLNGYVQTSGDISEISTEGSNHHPVIGPKSNIQFHPHIHSCSNEKCCQSWDNVVHIELFLLASLVVLNATAYGRISLKQ